MSEEKKKKTKLLWLWGLVPLVAILEIFVQWTIPRWEPSEEEWMEAAKRVRALKGERDLVLIAPDWATQARMYLGDAISMEDFGRFGTDRYDRIIELSADGHRAPETEDLSPESVEDLGKLSVSVYELGPAADVIYDFTTQPCSGDSKGKGKRVRNTIFIDHWFNPRQVVQIKLAVKPVSKFWTDVPLNGAIHGHGIVGYREARFGAGTPVKLEVLVDGEKIGEQIINNFGPLESFHFPVEKSGKGTVEFRVSTDDPAKRRFGVAADMRLVKREGPSDA